MTRMLIVAAALLLTQPQNALAWTQKDSARIYAPEAAQAAQEESANAARATAEAKAAAIHDILDRCHAISGTGIYGPADTMSFAEWNYRSQIYLACLSASGL